MNKYYVQKGKNNSMVNGLASNFFGLYMPGSTGSSSSMSDMTQGTSSNFDNISHSTGGTITRVPNVVPSFGVPFPQQSVVQFPAQNSFYGASNANGSSFL